MKTEIKIRDLTFVRESSCSPEQWWIYRENRVLVGYVRLRHGTLTASEARFKETCNDDDDFADVGSDVFTHQFKDESDKPCFKDEKECLYWLKAISTKFKK